MKRTVEVVEVGKCGLLAVRVADKFVGMNEVEDVRVETTGIMRVENSTRSVVKVATRNFDEAM